MLECFLSYVEFRSSLLYMKDSDLAIDKLGVSICTFIYAHKRMCPYKQQLCIQITKQLRYICFSAGAIIKILQS